MHTSRRFFTLFSTLAVASTLGTAAWAQQAKVTIYTAAPQDLIDHVVPAFEKASKIKVDVIKGGSGDLINRLKAEKGRQTADVIWAVGTEVIEANPGMFAKFAPENAKFFSPVFRINDAGVPFSAVATSIGVNTKLLTPAQYPKSWEDLAKPEFKGKISAPRPDKSGSAYIQLATILQIYGEDKGWALYTKILDNLVLSNSSGAVPKFVNDGEAAIGISNEDTLLKFKAGGGPVEIVYPTEGTAAAGDMMALLASAPNAENGKLFMNYMLSTEAQALVDASGRRPVRGDVPSKNALMPIAKFKVIKYDDDWAGANRARILAKWNDLLLNKK